MLLVSVYCFWCPTLQQNFGLGDFDGTWGVLRTRPHLQTGDFCFSFPDFYAFCQIALGRISSRIAKESDSVSTQEDDVSFRAVTWGLHLWRCLQYAPNLSWRNGGFCKCIFYKSGYGHMTSFLHLKNLLYWFACRKQFPTDSLLNT